MLLLLFTAAATLSTIADDQDDGFDLIEAFARPLPLAIIAAILGLSIDDATRLGDGASHVVAALEPIANDVSPAARAFHAGDVIDRVLEIEHHLATARVTMGDVLDTYGLVHDGPVKPFHDRVLAAVGLP
mgnify:CR=1 FL=1